MAKDYYKILGISRDATAEQIKKAYRTLAMQYHPDRNPGKEQWANEKFKEINEAFSVLGDPAKRQQYDRFGTTGNVNDIFGNAATRSTFEDLMRDFGGSGLGFDFLSNIFGDIFTGKGRGSGYRVFRSGGSFNLDDLIRQAQGQPPRQQYTAPKKEVSYEITIDKEQAKKGLEKDLTRKGKRLRVKIPSKVKDGTKIRLSNALVTTDRQHGDIIITVRVKG